MRTNILLVSLYHPELMRGGAQQACYELFRGLQEVGQDPILLASTERAISPSLFKSGATITGFDGRKNEFLFLSQGYDHEWHRNLQPASLIKFEEFVKSIRPNIIHFHHFMTYGLEYLLVAHNYLSKAGGKLALTFHEFLAMCLANGQMVRTFDKSLCDHQSSVRCHQCFPDRSPEHFSIRTMWIKHHLDKVDVFVAPSLFLRNKYVEWGIDEHKIVFIPNGHRYIQHVDPVTQSSAACRNRFGFFGQLVDNKGLLILIDAIKILRRRGKEDFRVDVNGANLQYGTEQFQKSFMKFLADENSKEDSVVRFNGSYELTDLPRLMSQIDWVIVPSTWGEIFGMVVSEAFMFGKPVICSNVGGIGERVRDNVDGLHFLVRNSESLADAMERAMTEKKLWARLHDNILPPETASDIARRHVELYNKVRQPRWEQITQGARTLPTAPPVDAI